MKTLLKRRTSAESLDPAVVKKFIRIVLPIAGQNLLSSLVSASDALMLSGLNQSSLSAVSLATQVSFVISLFYMSLTTGATILAAQYWGKGDKDTVNTIIALLCAASYDCPAADEGIKNMLAENTHFLNSYLNSYSSSASLRF